MSRPLANIRTYAPGDNITAEVVTAPVTANRFVKPGGNRTAGGNLAVTPAAAGDRPLGVAAESAAVGRLVHVARGGVARVVAAGTITAGAAVQVGTGGAASTASGSAVVVGLAVTGAADGELAEIALYA